MEIWKDIKGYEGLYQISNTGKVKSLNYKKSGKPKELKCKINKEGLREVNLYKNGKMKGYRIIQLVANHFIPKPSQDMIPTHIGDLLDDRVENIVFKSKKRPSYQNFKYENKKYKYMSELARKSGININTFLNRIKRGWTLEEATSIPTKRKKFKLNVKLYEYNGELYSVKQLAKFANVSRSQLIRRLQRGWNIYEAVEVPRITNNRSIKERRKENEI